MGHTSVPCACERLQRVRLYGRLSLLPLWTGCSGRETCARLIPAALSDGGNTPRHPPTVTVRCNSCDKAHQHRPYSSRTGSSLMTAVSYNRLAVQQRTKIARYSSLFQRLNRSRYPKPATEVSRSRARRPHQRGEEGTRQPPTACVSAVLSSDVRAQRLRCKNRWES